MTTELTIERACLALPHIVHAAQECQVITYKQLAEKVGCHWRSLNYPLGYIRDEICLPRGLPMLTAIVVNKSMRCPGDAWLPEGTEDLSVRENWARFQTECDRVFAYKQWDTLLKELGLARQIR